MFHDTSFWVAVSFVLFVAAIYKPIAKFIAGGLDNRRDRIKNELDEAKTLRESAQELLASFEKKMVDEEKEFVEKAKSQAAALIKEESVKLDEEIERKKKYAKKRIENLEVTSPEIVQRKITEIAFVAAQYIILDSYNDKAVSSDIKNMSANLKKIYK